MPTIIIAAYSIFPFGGCCSSFTNTVVINNTTADATKTTSSDLNDFSTISSRLITSHIPKMVRTVKMTIMPTRINPVIFRMLLIV